VPEVPAMSVLPPDLDAGSADDRAWFKRHVGRNHRIRKATAAERRYTSPGPGNRLMIVIGQIEPRVSISVPFGLPRGEPLLNAEAIAKRVFEEVFESTLKTILEHRR
jgi:hypothetical protein